MQLFRLIYVRRQSLNHRIFDVMESIIALNYFYKVVGDRQVLQTNNAASLNNTSSTINTA